MSDIRDELAEIDPDLLYMDGFDDCIIGICEAFGSVPVVAYDYDKMLAQSSGKRHDLRGSGRVS
jgi:hypothetical protein